MIFQITKNKKAPEINKNADKYIKNKLLKTLIIIKFNRPFEN